MSIKRLATVLIGKPEPSVDAVVEVARGINALSHDPASAALHALYDRVVKEPMPPEIMKELRALRGPRHYVPSAKGGLNGSGRRRAD